MKEFISTSNKKKKPQKEKDLLSVAILNCFCLSHWVVRKEGSWHIISARRQQTEAFIAGNNN